MRKTLFVSLEFPPFKGGVGRYVASIFETAPHPKKIVIPPTAHDENENILQQKLFFSFWWPKWLLAFFVLARLIKRQGFERLWVFQILPLGTVALLIKSIYKIPYIVSVYGMDLTMHKQSLWKKTLLRIILHRAENVVTISDYTTTLVQKFGIPPSKICKVAPIPFCTPKRKIVDPHKRLHLKNAQTKFLAVGRLVKRKNMHTLILALEKIKSENIHLSILGDGPEYATILENVQKLGLTDKISLHRDANDDELLEAYQWASALVFIPTSQDDGDSEGFGIVSIEAQGFGVPVIASKEGGVPDTFIDGKTGISVDPNNVTEIVEALRFAIKNPSTMKTMGDRARTWVASTFSPEKFNRNVNAVLGNFPDRDISVIIPAHNAERTITSCINSVKNQTLKVKEIIVINDGSTDTTQQILNSLPEIIAKSQEQHGAPSARNHGAKIALGNFLIFLDSDITMKKFALEIMRKTLWFHPNIAYAYSQFFFGWKKFPSYPYNIQLLKKHNYIHTSSLIRKEHFPGFDESLKRHQDWDLWLTVAERGGEGMRIEETLYFIHTEKIRISRWVPSFFYRLPFAKKIKAVADYEASASIIRKKHHLS